jgi:hypothetical protein
MDDLIYNATFSNISAISWRPVLVVEDCNIFILQCAPLSSLSEKEKMLLLYRFKKKEMTTTLVHHKLSKHI